MAVLFFDSSGLVKRYIAETGTARVIGLLRPSAANNIFIANIPGIEVASAIARRLKIGSISQTTAKKALTRFKRDFAKRFIVVELSQQIVEQGISLAGNYGLRGYDTTQLAVAMAVKNRLLKSGITSLTFISADNELNQTAQVEGLTIDNPNNH
ncbi:MAG TPA: type II toxin-antitoxin system VapC family toxin [Pyrinomonadaceae bacterium]